MTVTPEAIRRKWAKRSRYANKYLLDSLFELTDIMGDFPARDPRRQMAINEFAEAWGMSAATVRDQIGNLDGYEDYWVRGWFEAGLSMQHLEAAKRYASAKQMTPAALLDFAISNGPEGENMTVDEMINFALGEKNTTGAALRNFQKWFDGLMKLPVKYKWDEERAAKFREWLKLGWEFFEVKA